MIAAFGACITQANKKLKGLQGNLFSRITIDKEGRTYAKLPQQGAPTQTVQVGVAGVSGSMLPACEAVYVCKRRRALQGRQGATTPLGQFCVSPKRLQCATGRRSGTLAGHFGISPMRCTLVIPGLVPSSNIADEFTADLSAPALARLFSRGRPVAMPAESYDAWLCRLFDIDKQNDWPFAPITLLADGGNAEDAYWLRADPVHLRVNRDQLVLADSSVFDITQHESAAFSKALNQHFGSDGFVFEPYNPTRWYLRSPEPIDLCCTPLHLATGKNIDTLLPTGNDARRFRSLFNEAQMLLFSHPLNEARETEGRLPINSIWFWGGGKKPAWRRPVLSGLWANEPLAKSLAKTSSIWSVDLPNDADTWLSQQKDEGEHLIVIDTLLSPQQYGDAYAWQQTLNQLEQDWFAPLSAALQKGKITQLSITGFGDDRAIKIDVARNDSWKLWRRTRSLTDVLGNVIQ